MRFGPASPFCRWHRLAQPRAIGPYIQKRNNLAEVKRQQIGQRKGNLKLPDGNVQTTFRSDGFRLLATCQLFWLPDTSLCAEYDLARGVEQ